MGGNRSARRKPTTFGRVLTDSFHMSGVLGSSNIENVLAENRTRNLRGERRALWPLRHRKGEGPSLEILLAQVDLDIFLLIQLGNSRRYKNLLWQPRAKLSNITIVHHTSPMTWMPSSFQSSLISTSRFVMLYIGALNRGGGDVQPFPPWTTLDLGPNFAKLCQGAWSLKHCSNL